MSNERTPYLQELIRFSSKATLLIPRIIFNEECDKFKDVRDALNYLKNDEKLIIVQKGFNEDFIELTIGLKDGDGEIV